jgi:hypothetical protein
MTTRKGKNVIILLALTALILLKAPPAAWAVVGFAFAASLAGVHL